MGTLFGRTGELEFLAKVLRSSQHGRLVRGVRIVGSSGVGKTALVSESAARASVDGWLVGNVGAFRIHASLQLFTARRLVRAIVDGLGEKAERYVSGLDLETEVPERFEESFFRFVEGVTLDRMLLLVIDDAQWSDAASRALIVRVVSEFADRPIVVLSTERTDETLAMPLLSDEAIALSELSDESVAEISRDRYPDANPDVIAAIVDASRGRAVDAVALADSAHVSRATNAADVAAGTRRVIARDLALLDPATRTFLQTCALIDEPIDVALLREMWPAPELFELIDRVSGRYLVEDEAGIRFVHAAVMQSVQETIAIEIPLRQRVIAALQRLPSPRLEDLERIAEQAKACSDRKLERETRLRLADAAAKTSLYTLASEATERALTLAPVSPEEIVPLYTRLSQMYNAIGRVSDTIRVCRAGLRAAREAGMNEGLGGLAASLVIAHWHAGDADIAWAEHRRYSGVLTSPADQALLFTTGEYLAMDRADETEAQRYAQRFEAVRDHAHPSVVLRHHTAQAFLWQRLGNEAKALDHTEASERVAEALPPVFSTMPRALRLLHALRFRGVVATERLLDDTNNELSDGLIGTLRPQLFLVSGRFEDALEFSIETLARYNDTMSRRILLSCAATAAAFFDGESPSVVTDLIAKEVERFESGDRSPALLPLLSAVALQRSSKPTPPTHAMLEELVTMHGTAWDNSIYVYPVVLALAARTLRAADVLKRLAREGTLWTDAQPWNQGHALLARAVAAKAVGASDAHKLFSDARERLYALGHQYFVRFIDSELSAQQKTAPAEGTLGKTTRREREIAALVADGLSNRQIAEKLVLSERTVEGHIANLFAKVNVSSRTQLASWYLKSTNSVA